jgi:hypothetical protein
MAKRIRVYVAGKYSDNNIIDCLKNIGRGEKVCAYLFVHGYAPFCPWHDKTYTMEYPDREFKVDEFYEFSMAWLEVSDCVLVIPGWEQSKGTQKEIEAAKGLKIPVFYSVKDLNSWATVARK